MTNIWVTLFSKLDFIGHLPSLKLSGAPRNQTLFGGILCFLIYSVFILSALYFGQELVYRDIPTVIETNKNIEQNDNVKINKDNFLYFLSIRSKRNNSIIENFEKLINIKINLRTVNQDRVSLTSKEIPLRKCIFEDFDLSNHDKTFEYVNPEDYLCFNLPNEELSIKSTEIYDEYSYLSLEATINPEISDVKQIQDILIYIKNVDTTFNMRKFNNYGRPTLSTHFVILHNEIRQIYRIQLQLITYKTDIGYMFEDFRDKNFHRISYSDQYSFPIDNDNKLLQYDVFLSAHKQINYRKYYKFQNWVAELGGIVRALTLIAFVLNYFNDQSIYYEKMINNLFDVDDVIKYFQYSNSENVTTNGKKGPRDSIVLCSAKKEKNFFEKEYQQIYNCNSEIPINNYMTVNSLTRRHWMTKTSLNEQKSNLKGSNVNKRHSSPHSSEEDPHELYIDSLRKNKNVKEHFEKVKKSRFRLSPLEMFLFCICKKKESPKYNSFIGGKTLITERADIIYILRKNLQFDRFKNLILRDYQVLLLNSLTKFMLDPERVNLSTFESCHYDKFIDAYDNVTSGNNVIDLKLSKWIENKFKFENKS